MKEGTIIKRTDVCFKFHNGFKRKLDEIEELVIHGTVGKSATGFINWILI